MPSYTSTPTKGRRYNPKRKKAEERKPRKPVRVSVPYAPTAKGKAAERADRRERQAKAFDVPTLGEARRDDRKKRRRRRRLERRALAALPDRGRGGSRKTSQPVLRELKDKRESASREEQLRTAVERDVAEPLKRAGYKKTTGQKIYQKVAEVGSTALPFAPEIAAGGKALNLALRGAQAGGTRVGGSKALSRVLQPKAATTPKARAEVRLRAGERASGAVTKAKRYGGKKARVRRAGKALLRSERRADRAAARRATGTATPREVFSQAPVAGKIAKGAATQNLPVVRGHEQAIVESPGKTAKTTARALPGLVTAPAGIIAGAGLSAGRAASTAAPGLKDYSGKDIAAPVKGELDAQLEFAKQVAKVVTSSDPDYVQKEVEENLGLLLPIMAGIGGAAAGRRLSKGRVQKAVRGTVENVRRRHGLEHSGAPKVFENVAQRKGESIRTANARLRIRRETADRARTVRKHALKIEGKEVLRSTSRGKKVTIRGGDTVGFLARHGIDLDDPDAALAEVKRIGAQIKDLPEGVRLPVDQLNTRDVVAFLERNPNVLADPNLRKALTAYKDQARYARERPELAPESSERARFLSVASTRGILYPEERFPVSVRDAVRATPGRGRLAKDTLRNEAKADRRRAKKLRKKAETREARARAMRRELGVRERVEPGRAVNARVSQRADRFDAQARTYREGAKRAEEIAKRKQAAARAPAPETLDEFLTEVKATGREPEYVYTGRGKEAPVHGATGPKLSQFPGRSKFRKGTAEEYGMVQEGLEPLLRESIARPTSRRESYRAMRGFIDDNQVEWGQKREFTSAEARELFDEGKVNRTTHVLLPKQLYKRAYDEAKGKVDELPDAQWVGQLRAALEDDAQEALLAKGGDRKYKVVKRQAAEEFFAQMTTERMLPGLAKANRWTSYLILGTSPAWAAMQILAEFGQAALAQPKLLNPSYARKALKAYHGMEPHKRQAFESWVGVTQRVVERVEDVKLGLDAGDLEAAHNAYGVMNRTPTGQLIKSIPRAIEKVDRWKGGRIRALATIAKIDKDLNGRLNHFIRGMGGLYREGERLSAELKGKPLAEQLNYFAEHPKAAKQYQSYLDDVMGNWSALTRNERVASQLVIFYPFLRMSLRWTFYSFPKRHPVKAAMGYYLGQQNAEELSKLLKNDPSFFTKWGQVPLDLGDGEKKIIDLSRIAPGSNALVEALGGDAQGPTGIVGARIAQPVLAAVGTAIYGVSPLSGEQEPNSGLNAIAQLLSLSPLSREADKRLLPEGEKRANNTLPIFGKTKRQNSLDKLFEKLRGSAETQSLRSLFFPPLPKALSSERDVAHLSQILETIEANKSEKRKSRTSELFEQGVPKGRAQKETRKMKEEYDRAQRELNKLFQKHKISYKGEEGRFKDYFGDVYYQNDKPDPFGLPDTSSDSLRQQFGLPDTSTEKLKEQFGIE